MQVKYWILCSILLCFVFIPVQAGTDYCFRVYLKDKGDSGFSVTQPDAYLTKAAIERRNRSGVQVTQNDLPISVAYIDSLKMLGASPVTQSKWLSTIVVSSPDSLISERISNLSMVDSVKWVWKGEPEVADKETRDTTLLQTTGSSLNNKYGYAENQIQMLNGNQLHELGYTGNGMMVAVIDAGFSNVDRLEVFESLHLSGTYNAINPGKTVFEGDDHGTKVLSCMAANLSGVVVGTAPDASYWLIKSEDSRSEFPIEEDYWAAAVEFADSVGVDVITTSLGYFHFDSQELNYNHSLLDGKSAFISKAAVYAAEKGMLIFCSAGNEGNGAWGKIIFPSDVSDIITVGAITEEGNKSTFSSTGFTADYRVKPDLVALGTYCTVIDQHGSIRYVNGTSFSTPIVAGLGTCLWQAFPSLTNLEIVEILRKVSSRSDRPDAELGYGIPDMMKAYKLGKEITSGI